MTEEYYRTIIPGIWKDIMVGEFTPGDASLRVTWGDSQISVQNPVPSDGDSVYCKDVWIEESITTDWVNADDSEYDVACIPFTNLHTRIENTTATNPKVLRIHFNRTINAHQVGIGCVGGGNFSNVTVKLLGSGGVIRTAVDDSSNNTKYTSNNYPFQPQLFNAVQLEFSTADPVCISNITIQKSVNVGAQIQGLRPDDTIGTVSVTQGDNLKVSLEELESQVSVDNNSKLNVMPYTFDEFGNYSKLLGDDIFRGAIVAISPEHHEIHCGDSYEATDNVTLGNGATRYYLITVPNEPGTGQDQKLFHFLKRIESAAEVEVELFEDTVATGGNAITVHNRNRNSALADFLTITHTPTITSNGNNLWGPWRIGSGRAIAGESSRTNEFVLKNNTKYLLRITNQTASNNNVTVEFDYYVHPGI